MSPSLAKGFTKAAGGERANSKKSKRPAPFSIRLSFEERARLLEEAGDAPLGFYIRSRLLGDEQRPRRKRRSPSPDREALGRLLGELGGSRLAVNLTQLARAANSGSLPVTPDVVAALRDACATVQHMRLELLKALGLEGGG
ncbi:plasmid mobilization relaxosome protein MobC [Oceanibaculum nanhaiense]|uniref:plasmid mobilization relaxosome protein MobC n=1 Tax=Oceanibaculum nanhaiense TaxID=1909734 RepID=UPI003D26A874